MTLTVCLEGLDGLVIASDSRGTSESGVFHDNLRKVYLIRNVGVLTAGGRQSEIVIEIVKKAVSTKGIENVTDIMEELRAVAIRVYDEWFPVLSPFGRVLSVYLRHYPPRSQMIIAGYDRGKGDATPRIYTVMSTRESKPSLSGSGFALAGITDHALKLVNGLYICNMDVASLKHLAAHLITETARLSVKVGGPVQMAVIPSKGQAYTVPREEVNSIVSSNRKRFADLRDSVSEE